MVGSPSRWPLRHGFRGLRWTWTVRLLCIDLLVAVSLFDGLPGLYAASRYLACPVGRDALV